MVDKHLPGNALLLLRVDRAPDTGSSAAPPLSCPSTFEPGNNQSPPPLASSRPPCLTMSRARCILHRHETINKRFTPLAVAVMICTVTVCTVTVCAISADSARRMTANAVRYDQPRLRRDAVAG